RAAATRDLCRARGDRGSGSKSEKPAALLYFAASNAPVSVALASARQTKHRPGGPTRTPTPRGKQARLRLLRQEVWSVARGLQDRPRRRPGPKAGEALHRAAKAAHRLPDSRGWSSGVRGDLAVGRR